MTRKKAIEIMQINRDGVANMSWSEDRTKTLAAFDMAIKALEQEPCDDAISREAALRQAINAHKMAQENGFNFKDICEEYLNVLPPVTPKQRTGHWIETWLSFWCSECKTQFGGAYKFCPNCGAKMVEPQESEGV